MPCTINCYYYDSTVHLEFEGIKVDTIILFFALKVKKNIIGVIKGSAVVLSSLYRQD